MTVLRSPLRTALRSSVYSPLVGKWGGRVFSPVESFAATKQLIVADSGNVDVAIITDSTGDATTEWPYLFAGWLANQHPTHTVSIRYWNDTDGDYDDATTLSTGSGSNTITIWCFAVSGTNFQFIVGAKLAPGVVDVDPDLIIWSHGHNTVSDYTDNALLRGQILIGAENVRLALPTVPQVFVRQNPRRDDSQMANVMVALDAIVESYGDTAPIDVYSRAWPSSWYQDSVHPNSTGQQQGYAATIQGSWRSTIPGLSPVASAFMAAQGTNRLINGDFSNMPGVVPLGWDTAGSIVCAEELVIVDDGDTRSVKVTGTTAQGNIQQSFTGTSLTPFLGQTVTLALRQFVPEGSAGTVGRIALYHSGGAGGAATSTTRAYAVGMGGWRWMFISGFAVPADATLLRAFLYCDTAANTDSTAYLGRATLVIGDLPRDMEAGPSLGPELVVNGAFASDLSGWTAGTGASWNALGRVTLAGSGGTGGATQSFVQQALTTEAATYLVACKGTTRTGSFSLGTADTQPIGGADGRDLLSRNIAAGTWLYEQVVLPAGTTYLTLNRTASGSCDFDDVSIRKVL